MAVMKVGVSHVGLANRVCSTFGKQVDVPHFSRNEVRIMNGFMPLARSLRS